MKLALLKGIKIYYNSKLIEQLADFDSSNEESCEINPPLTAKSNISFLSSLPNGKKEEMLIGESLAAQPVSRMNGVNEA